MDVIATVAAPLDERLIESLVHAGATIFRLNGAHLSGPSAAASIRDLRRIVGSAVRILLDLPTNKLRTGDLAAPVPFRAGDHVALRPDQVNFPRLYQYVQPGDEVVINDGRNHLSVVQVNDETIVLRAQNDGQLGRRRGLIFSRLIQDRSFPLLFAHDRDLLAVCRAEPVDLLGISYLRYPEHKAEIREAAPAGAQFLWKIETRQAMQHLSTLVEPGDALLIDRGDLAGEIGLIDVVEAQRMVFHLAHSRGCPVSVATQFLGSMMQHPVPSLSDVHSLYETIALGAAGIQLSEETAQGDHPVGCVEFVRQVERRVHEARSRSWEMPASLLE
jgi:pyruvate kinase